MAKRRTRGMKSHGHEGGGEEDEPHRHEALGRAAGHPERAPEAPERLHAYFVP
jgi:hypothetical protein